MSAEMIASWAWVPGGTTLNWDAGLALIPTLSDEELQQWVEQRSGDYLATNEEETGISRDEARNDIREAINDLREDEDVLVISAPEQQWILWLAGGTSWGDDPNHAFTCLSNLWSLPLIMKAIGFFVGRES